MKIMSFSTIFLLIIIVIQNWGLVFATDSVNMSPEDLRNPNGLVCGPRVVQYILKHNGQDVELIELIREMQWPKMTQGSSFVEIEDALQQRGIHTAAIQFPLKNTALVWTEPVIVHFQPETDESLGHFVVWLPKSTRNTSFFWDGLNGVQTLERKQFIKKMSGAVILTSPDDINDPQKAIQRMVVIWPYFVCTLFVLLLFPFKIFFCEKVKKKCKNET